MKRSRATSGGRFQGVTLYGQENFKEGGKNEVGKRVIPFLLGNKIDMGTKVPFLLISRQL